MVLNIGEVVPEFELETSEGDMFRLSDLEGQWKVVFFFAKSGSPTCKRGCLSFKEQYELFQSLEPSVEVIGISQDTVQQHKKFKKELDLPFPLLSDQERNVAEKFESPSTWACFPLNLLSLSDRTIPFITSTTGFSGLGSTLLRLSRRLAVMGGSRWTGTRY